MPNQPDQPWMPSRPESTGETDRWLVLVVLGFCAVSVAGIAAVGALAYWFLLRSPDGPAVAVEGADDKRAALQAAFGSDDIGVDETTLAPIRALFDEIQAADEDPQFQRLVDVERFFQEMLASGAMPRQPRFMHELYRESVAQSMYRPWAVARYRLRYIERRSESDVVAHGYFWDVEGDLMEMRWWLTSAAGRWKVYDWELLQIGSRNSRQMALYFAHSTDDYNRFYEELTAAHDAYSRYDRDAGRAALLRAERLLPQIAEPLRGETTAWAALHWCWQNEYDDALRLAALVSDPSAAPAVHWIRLQKHVADGNDAGVLDSCAALEAAIGPTPNAARPRAESLDRLGQREAATAAVEQLLRLDPVGGVPLGRLVLLLPPAEITRLAAAFGESAEDSAGLRQLADTLIGYGDVQAVRQLAQSAPQAADKAYLRGLHAQAIGDDVQAADAFLIAMQQAADTSSADRFRYSYLTLMSQLDRLATAYAAMPDEHADDAFVTLLSQEEDTLESYLRPEQLQSLLAAHAERGADDPQWHLARAGVALREGDIEASIAACRSGLSFVDVDNDETGVSDALDQLLTTAVVATPDGWRTAYASADDPVATFSGLAARLAAVQRWDALDELATLHAAAHPDDLMPVYYSGLVALERGDAARAEKLLAAGQHAIKTPEEEWDYQRSQFRDLRIRARFAAGDAAAVYDDPTLRPAALAHLAPYFASRGETEQLATLARRARQENPSDPYGWEWAVAGPWHARDFEAVATVLDNAPWSDIDVDEYYQYQGYLWRTLATRRFRALLRLGRFDQAAAALRFVGDDAATVNERIALHAVRGEIEQARQLLRNTESQAYSSPYDDPDAAAILWGDAFRDLREQHPPPFPAYIACRQWILLQREPPALTAEQVQGWATAALGDTATVEQLVSTHPEHPPAWLIAHDTARLILCAADDPYTGSLRPSAADYPDPDVFAAVREHRAWLQVCAMTTGDSDDGRLDAAAARLLQACVNPGTLGLYDANQPHVFPAGAELDAFLANGLQRVELADGSAWHYLTRGVETSRETMFREWLRRPLHVFALEQYRGTPQDWQVALSITCGDAAETVTAAVDSVEPDAYSGWSYNARLTSDSKLRPNLRAGERITFNEYSVADWTIATPAGERHGRQEAAARWNELQQTAPSAPATSAPAAGE